MSGGLDYKWFREQSEGIAMLSTANARRRAAWRAARYQIETEGFGAYLRARYDRA